MARPGAAVSGAVRLAGEARAAARPGAGAGVPSADAGASAGGRRTSPALQPADWRAEWKWDGIRVQLVATEGGRRLYSRGADDISGAFPEIVEAMDFHAVLDGELLVVRDGQVGAVRRSAAAAEPQGGQRAHDGGLPGRHPALRHAVRGGRGRAPAAVRCAARAAGGVVCADAAGADGSVGADPVLLARRADGAARRRACGVDRGADAEARRCGLRAGSGEGAVVEVEARSADASTRC